MGYLLKEALKTLCGDDRWSYAVFWKIGCQNPKLLIWEECYYEPASYLGGLEGFSEVGNPTINFQDYSNSSFPSESLNLQPSVPARDQAHDLVNKMMADGNVKVVGEGLVGMVAFTGNYQWILSENYCGEPQSLEVLKEAFQQFSSGMQTVAVIPVLPHGVVQFGSNVTIPENIGFVKGVVSLILELGHMLGVLQSENRQPKELVHGLLPFGSNSMNTSYSAGSFSSPECSAQTIVLSNDQTSFQASNLVGSSHLEAYEAKIAVPSLTSPNQFINRVSKNPNSLTNLQSSSSFSMHTCVPDKGSAPIGFKDSIFSQALVFCDSTDRSEDDLFDVLGADFKKKMVNSSLNGCNMGDEPGKISFQDISWPGPTKLESGILSFKGADAVVSKGQPNRSSDESVSCVSTLTNVSGSSSSKAVLPQGLFGNFDQSKGTLFGVLNYAVKGKEVSSGTSKPSRKRPKPGDNPRPRPRDRQMIQDRVKELREIVPNGAKCSIDCLLERTIKHMLFLQGVTSHADQLKQAAESKIMGESHLKDNSGSGVAWACEVGLPSTIRPIIVEDINEQPHQMLVQMICEERGSFLEIAGIIRGLGLTILKGLMENRDGKVWARFTVEANRQLTRMDIFLLLARRLDQNAKPGYPKSVVKTENVMAHECHQAASVIC